MPRIPTGFDYLSHDPGLREHWFRRVVALVVDAILIFLPVVIFLALIRVDPGWLWVYSGILAGIILFVYSAFLEGMTGGTVGKHLLHLKAVPVAGGRMTVSHAVLRNVTKLFWPILILDWIGGMLLETTDPRQRFVDRLSGTSVILLIAGPSPGQPKTGG